MHRILIDFLILENIKIIIILFYRKINYIQIIFNYHILFNLFSLKNIKKKFLKYLLYFKKLF